MMKKTTCILALLLLVPVVAFPTSHAQDNGDARMIKAAVLIRSLSDAGQTGSALPTVLLQPVEEIISSLRRGETEQAARQWRKTLELISQSAACAGWTAGDIASVKHTILKQAYGPRVEDVRYLADRVRYYRDALSAADAAIAELQEYGKQVGDGEMTVTTTHFRQSYAYAEQPQSLGSVRRMGGSAIDAEIRRLQALGQTFSDKLSTAVEQLRFAVRRRMWLIEELLAADQMLSPPPATESTAEG